MTDNIWVQLKANYSILLLIYVTILVNVYLLYSTSLDRLKIDDANMVQHFDENLLMEHLIPTCSGNGVITTALVDFLAITHNRFVRDCHKTIEQSMNR